MVSVALRQVFVLLKKFERPVSILARSLGWVQGELALLLQLLYPPVDSLAAPGIVAWGCGRGAHSRTSNRRLLLHWVRVNLRLFECDTGRTDLFWMGGCCGLLL